MKGWQVNLLIIGYMIVFIVLMTVFTFWAQKQSTACRVVMPVMFGIIAILLICKSIDQIEEKEDFNSAFKLDTDEE